MHFAANRAAPGAGGTVLGQQPGLGFHLVQVLGDRKGVPDTNLLVGQAWNQE